ncbi:MAG: hypothetical protein J6C46_04240 [Clostridia bacterium]|nr:hypothetical protein [Clostridia bacterium]
MNFETRRDLAKNLNTPLTILDELSKDKNWRIRYYVAKNPRTPLALRVKLGRDNHPVVRDAIENAIY